MDASQFFFLLAERRGMSLFVYIFIIFPLNTHTHTHIHTFSPFSHTPLSCFSNLKKKSVEVVPRKPFEPFRAGGLYLRIFLFLTTNLPISLSHPSSQFTLHRRSNKYNNTLSRCSHPLLFHTFAIIVPPLIYYRYLSFNFDSNLVLVRRYLNKAQ